MADYSKGGFGTRPHVPAFSVALMHMSIPTKTLSSGFSLPVLGLGTWHMGGGYTRRNEHDEAEVVAIRRAIDAGVTHIDTAEMYGEGHSEELIGRAIEGVDRGALTITSKVWPNHLTEDGVLRALDASLRRLKTTYLDLYLVHWPNPSIPLTHTMRAMNTLVDRGHVRAIGVSNFSKDLLMQAQACSEQRLVCNQVQYNLVHRNAEQTGLLAYCQEHDVLLNAWRPIRDVLGSKMSPLLLSVAKKYEKTPAQIALNWLLSQQNVVTVTKMASPAHLQENLGAVGWVMEQQDIDHLRREYPGQVGEARETPTM